MRRDLFTDSIVITGGGTGGHYFPAVALAEGLCARYPERNIVFVGSRYGIESRLAPNNVWPYVLFDVEGFVGRSINKSVKAVYKLLLAYRQIKRIWRQHRPWVVIGTGGYGSAPALMAAVSLRVPFFLHESNAKPGLVVRLLASKATSVWCGMRDVNTYLTNANCITTGTPVRAAFLRSFSPLDKDSFLTEATLLVLGGSGGASAINLAMLAIAPTLLEQFPHWHIVHQVGQKAFNKMAAHITHPRHIIVPFLDNMDIVMESARLVVTRSGASTCAELKACGRPAIMVPMPSSAGNHQVNNAQAMVHEECAVMLQQTEHLSHDLLYQLANLMANPEQIIKLSHAEPNEAVKICLDDMYVKLS